MFYRLTRSMVGVGFALVTAVIVAAPASAAMPAASASVAVPHMVADAGVDQDSAWANHGKNSNQGKHVGPKGDCDKDSDRRSDCKNPSPIPPAPTPTPVPTAPPCLPSSVSGSYVNSAYDRSGVGMVSFSNTCPASASSTSFTANLTGLVSPFNAAGTQVGLFIGTTVVAWGTVDASGNFSVLPASFFDPAVPQYLPVGVSVGAGTVVDFWSFQTVSPLNCYPCSQNAGTVQGNRLGSATLI